MVKIDLRCPPGRPRSGPNLQFQDPLEYLGLAPLQGRRRRAFDHTDGIDVEVILAIRSKIAIPATEISDSEGKIIEEELEKFFESERDHIEETVNDLSWEKVVHDPSSLIDESKVDIFQPKDKEGNFFL